MHDAPSRELDVLRALASGLLLSESGDGGADQALTPVIAPA
jgi:hypothetical protein